jgi:Fur family peroxide stress response transcriptional regulator
MPSAVNNPPHRATPLLTALKQAGRRLTPQRLAICRALAERRDHPTAQALFEQLAPEFPSLSRATVYNTLQTLVSAGLIHELGDAGDGAQHYDADASPHLNLICRRCHRIEDFPATTLTRLAQRVTTQSGYQLQGARLAYYGLCPKCQKIKRRR